MTSEEKLLSLYNKDLKEANGKLIEKVIALQKENARLKKKLEKYKL